MRFRLLTSLTVLVVGIVIPATARQGDSPQLLFEAGHKAEVVDGDLRGAIRQYQAALQRFGTNRTIAAEALSRMATAYEKLGDPQHNGFTSGLRGSTETRRRLPRHGRASTQGIEAGHAVDDGAARVVRAHRGRVAAESRRTVVCSR